MKGNSTLQLENVLGFTFGEEEKSYRYIASFQTAIVSFNNVGQPLFIYVGVQKYIGDFYACSIIYEDNLIMFNVKGLDLLYQEIDFRIQKMIDTTKYDYYVGYTENMVNFVKRFYHPTKKL